MKQFKLIMALSLVFLIGTASTCTQDHAKKYATIHHQTIVLDGCEYIITQSGERGYMAHKGNCKYCAARREALLKKYLNK